jgi:hypothetical protein
MLMVVIGLFFGRKAPKNLTVVNGLKELPAFLAEQAISFTINSHQDMVTSCDQTEWFPSWLLEVPFHEDIPSRSVNQGA